MTIPAVLDRAFARLSVAASDREAAAAHVRWALEQAAADHAAFTARSTKAPEMRRLAQIGGIASKAAEGDAAAVSELRSMLGDGREVDALLAEAFGGALPWNTAAASRFAAARAEDAAWTAGVLEASCRWATAPMPRRRREGKFFAVLALGFAYVDITGDVPTFSTDKDTAETDGSGARVGRFAELVDAADLAFGIPGGDTGFDAAIPDALRVGSLEIAEYHRAAVPRWPPPFGTPMFRQRSRRFRQNEPADRTTP